MNTLDCLRQMPDCDLVASLDDLARRDRETSAAILAHLVVVVERSIHLDCGYASIIEYSTDRLGTSRDVAYKRAAAVKVAALHPEVITWLSEGETTLSALAVLAPHRDDAELVAADSHVAKRQTVSPEGAAAHGASRRDVQKLAAARHPDPDWNRRQSRVHPVAAGLSKLEMTVPDELLARIEQALDLDSHIDPGRDLAALLDRALGVYIEKRTRERFAVTENPRPARHQGPTTRVPAMNLRATYQTSGGQCEYVSPDGRRCSARAFLEIDHVVPRAQGGGHDRVRLLCRMHNQRAAEIALGKPRMDEARRRASQVRELKAALLELGYPAKVAGVAAKSALDTHGAGGEIEVLIKEALIKEALLHAACRCPRTTASEPGPIWRLRPGPPVPAPSLVAGDYGWLAFTVPTDRGADRGAEARR